MSRLRTVGFEVGMGQVGLDGAADSVTPPVTDTGTFRSGAKSAKCDSTAGNTTSYFDQILAAAETALGRTQYVRAYLNFSSLPASTVPVLRLRGVGGVDFGSARLTSGGKLQLWNDVAASQIGSDSTVTIQTGQWYRISLSAFTNTGSVDSLSLRLGEDLVASASSLALAEIAIGECRMGWILAPGASKQVYVDDFAWNDSVGSAENNFPPDAKVVLLKPISDSVVGSWTGGAGGTTNLYDAINNTPPIGHSTETDLTQIENAINGGGTNYQANLTSYTTAGIGASDIINVVHPFVEHGEDVNAGTKTGQFKIVSNPAGSFDTFTFGDDAGALGVWPLGWAVKWGTPIYQPTPTLGTSPVMEFDKTDTGTRVASIDLAGIYVEYIPGASQPMALRKWGTPTDGRLKAGGWN